MGLAGAPTKGAIASPEALGILLFRREVEMLFKEVGDRCTFTHMLCVALSFTKHFIHCLTPWVQSRRCR